jgi:hypothetical protein
MESTPPSIGTTLHRRVKIPDIRVVDSKVITATVEVQATRADARAGGVVTSSGRPGTTRTRAIRSVASCRRERARYRSTEPSADWCPRARQLQLHLVGGIR